ncbi:hypothetical protein D3C73_851220 [compost metagenome]
MQGVAHLLLTREQGCVFVTQRRPILRGKEAQPVEKVFANDTRRGRRGELDVQHGLFGKPVQHLRFQMLGQVTGTQL